MRPNGEFVRIAAAATDGTRGIHGRWQLEAGQRLRIQYDDGREETMTIMSIEEELLKIQTDE
jgi:hypothetical protein